MAQKHSGASRQSDFPIFEYLNLLLPTRLWQDFKAMPRHQRGLVISIIASMILSLVIVGFGRAAVNHYLATRGAFLYDALQSPYQIEGRGVPMIPTQPNTLLLPEAVGDYIWQIPLTEEQRAEAALAEVASLVMMTSAVEQVLAAYEVAAAPAATAPEAELSEISTAATTAEPLVTIPVEQQTLVLETALTQVQTALPVIEKADALAEIIAAPELYAMRGALDTLAANDIALTEVNDLLLQLNTIEAELAQPVSVNNCLLSSEDGPDAMPVCGLTLNPLYIEAGTYETSATIQPVAVTMAAFEDHDTATAMMKDLYRYADAQGQTGNYTLGVTPVDYFYSRLNGQYTFVWSHDNWVYSISAPTFTDMEILATAFPY